MAQSSPPIRLMTYNIGGGRRDFGNLAAILDVIREASPDILVVQEATAYQNADGAWFSTAQRIAEAGGFGDHYYFGPTITMKEHLHVRKSIMVHALFADWQDWQQGNAIFCRRGFVRLSDSARAGSPRNVPLYRPPVYEGNRDTDPRSALLARADCPPQYPYVAGVHLTTLLGERGPEVVPGRSEEAQILRFRQARRLLDLLGGHVLQRGEPVFLMGDFNAVSSEPSIAAVLEGEGGFVRLKPSDGPLATHPKVPDGIDHILVYPAGKLAGYRCWTVDTPAARSASDHLPVVAEVTIT